MPEPISVETEEIALRRLGEGSEEIQELGETEITTLSSSNYISDGRNERASYAPKSADELNALRRVLADLRRLNLTTQVGLMLVIFVTFIAGLTFLGFTNSVAPSAHEDAKSILLLVIGAVIGALFRSSTISDDRTPPSPPS